MKNSSGYFNQTITFVSLEKIQQMEFTENFKKSDNFRIVGQMLYIIDEQGKELELFVGEEIETARWSDKGHLIVVLKSGAVRSYEDEVNYIKI